MAVALTVGGTPATEVTVVSDTELTARAPRGVGVVDVAVTTAGGIATAEDAFTYTPPALAFTFVTTTTNQVAQIGLSGCAAGNFMDWGDGTRETFSSSNPALGVMRTHTYAEPGTYRAGYYGKLARIGASAAGGPALVSVDRWGADAGITNAQGAFRNSTNLTTVAPPNPGITDMSSMFYGAAAFNGDVSGWDVSAVTSMSEMFRSAAAFNGDVSAWDVSSVTSTAYMFDGATVFNQDLSGWDTSSVTRMARMFARTAAFDQDLSAWDTSSVTDMSYMFNDATAFNQALSAWDVSSVTDMSFMFYNAAAFNQDLSAWDVAQVVNHTSFNAGANPVWVANAAWQPQWVVADEGGQ